MQTKIFRRRGIDLAIFETLKHAYASKFKGYKKKKYDFLKLGSKEIYDFKELVYEMFSEFDININKVQNWIDNTENCIYSLKKKENYSNNDLKLMNEICSSHNIQWKESFILSITDYRNEIIHSGKFETGTTNLFKHYGYLEKSVELLLIKIMNINCEYWDSRSGWINTKKLLSYMK